MTRTILVFIPKEFCHEKPGYTFGKVVYDPSNESKKFFIVGVRKVDSSTAVKSNNDLIGHFSNSNNVYGYLDKTLPDWINVYLSDTSGSSSVSYEYCIRDVVIDNRKISPSSYHTVIIIYDQMALLRAELLINKSPSEDHFQELKQILHTRSIEDEICKKSKFSLVGEILLTYHALLLLYPIQFLSKIANDLLPIFKYSTLGLHLHSWLENAKWTLATIIQRKRITLKTGNHIFAMMVDVLLGVLLLQFLLENIGYMPPSRILLKNAEMVVDSLRGLVNWLMGAPAGLKLNHSFNGMLGRFFLYHINLWWTFLLVTKPVLEFAFKVMLLCGRLGITFQIAIIADLLALVSFHSYCIYVYAARLFNMQLRGLKALFHLFLGKKQNPLRERVDSCQYQPDQLFVGTLLFTILLFLMPTTWVYYVVFTTLRLVLIGLAGFLTRLRFYLQVMPVYAFLKWLVRSPVTSSTINMEMYVRAGEGPTTLIVSTVVSPWGETWKRCIPETASPAPPVEWAKILNNVFLDLRRVRDVLRRFNANNTVKATKNRTGQVMKVLNVAEKNDAAKGIAGYLSRGSSHRREGLSVYNKIYEFDTQLWGQQCKMIMTSVSGHLLNYEFVGGYRSWQGCNPLSLFEAPVVKQCEENFMKIKRTLEREAKACQALIIWTDCDREGENIGFEVIQVCQAVKPNIKIYRAKFSEITAQSVHRALHNLAEPNKAVSDAVDVRSELDLRIGAAFTRFQTMRLQKVFPRTLAEMLISYGSCQFPTLGFVVERFLAIESFKPEPFWRIKVMDVRNEISVEFRWERNRLFEELPCQIFLDMCLESPNATVEKVICKPKTKWRPLPLDTVELAKLGSRKLKLNAKETMKIAEKLYTQGIISYPRTETNIFPKELNLVPLVEQQTASPQWGPFAQKVLQNGPSPRQGKKNDGAHPPIHPTKYIATLGGNEARLYEFIVRYFLACLSKDAEGQETVVHIDIAEEKFVASGLRIIAKNYLEVYPYETWAAKEIHAYEEGQTFRPTSIEMITGETSPPNLLTEADLIALMDKHGIGTDATHAEHIEKIKSRQYVGLKDQKYFIPGKLGIGLVMGYDSMGFHMSKPHLRAGLENDLKLICDGVKLPADVLRDQVARYKAVFTAALEQANLIDEALAHYLDEAPAQVQHVEIANPQQDITVFKCPKCGNNMTLKDRRNGPGKYIGCMAFPTCNNSIWFPPTVEDVEILNNTCNRCPGNMPLIKFSIRAGSLPHLGTSYTSCIGGCDTMLNETLNIQMQNVQSVPQAHSNSATAAPNSNLNSRTNNSRPQNTQRQTNGQAYNARGNDTGHSDSGVSSWNSSSITARPRHESCSSSSSQNQQNTGGTADTILCNCHEIAKQLTVRKEGPNQGRQFYKCAKPQADSCDFFLWGGDGAAPNSQPSRNDEQPSWNSNGNNSYVNSSNVNSSNRTRPRQTAGNRYDRDAGDSSATQVPVCTCGQPARKLTVHKDGPNKGREFYGCPQGMGSTCKFFKWADEIDDGNEGRSSSRGNNRGGSSGNSNSSTARPASRRKCGICGEEGHTRRTCTRNT